MTNVKTYLMFQGDAQQAVDLYLSIFKDFTVRIIERYGKDEPVAKGAFKVAKASLAGHEFIIFDSPPMHDFSFTPSISITVDFDIADELETAFARLSEGGKVMMPLDDYGFSKRYSWIADRFGVSWQLNLPQ
jgi:predicted 3-demethylubiquinone-9 3-methyltransferase (glyoxalase superfamily)